MKERNVCGTAEKNPSVASVEESERALESATSEREEQRENNPFSLGK